MYTLQASPWSTAVRRCWELNATVHSPAEGQWADTLSHIICFGGLAGDVRVMSTSPLERGRFKRCGEAA